MSVKNVVKVMNFHSLLKVDKSRRKAAMYFCGVSCCAAEEVDAGDAVICKRNCVGGVDVLLNLHVEADFFFVEFHSVAKAHICHNERCIEAEDGACHIHVDAEADVFKLFLMNSIVHVIQKKLPFEMVRFKTFLFISDCFPCFALNVRCLFFFIHVCLQNL